MYYFSIKTDEVIKLKRMNFLKKLSGILLAILIVCMTVTPAFAVTYPAGITAEQAESAMTKTDVMLHTLLSETEGKSLAEVVTPLVLSDATLSSLAKMMYSMGEENAQTFSAIGLNLAPSDVAAYLNNYPDVRSRLMTASSWSTLDLSDAVWGVETVSDFVNAAVALFTPMNGLLYAILCGGSYSLNSLVGIQGSNGYEKSVIKIFEKVGLTTYTDPATFYAQAEADKSSMVSNLVYDVAEYISYVCSAPATIMSTYLPGLAYYIENGGLDQAIGQLVEPLRIKILGITTPVKIGSVMELTQAGEAGTSFDFDIDIGEFSASGTIQTAPFDMTELASFAEDNVDVFVVNRSDAFIYVFRWLLETVKLNIGSIPQMLSEMDLGMDASQLSQILTVLFSKSTDELMSVYINLLTAQSGKVNPYVWSFNPVTPSVINYTPNLGRDKYQRVLDGIDTLIGDFIKESGEADSIKKLAAPEIYSNAVVTKLVTTIYGLLESEEASMLMKLAGLDISPAALAARLTEDAYVSAREALDAVTSYSQLQNANINWGFKNGNRDGFIRAVSAVFRPLDSLLKMVLCGDSLTVLGAVSFYGSDGYNTAVIPMLEAIGCTFEEIRTYDEFVKEVSKTDVMFPIVQALVTLIERMLEYPVYTITGILPNLMYFINNGGLEICINNLLYPVTSVIDSLGLSAQLNLSQFTEIDTDKIMDELVGEIDLGVKLPELDLAQFASIGNLVTVQTKRTQAGQPMTIQYLQSDRTGVLITLLRYMVQIMKTPGNEGIVDSFMASSNGDNEMFATYSADIGTQLAEMSVDETIEWLYKIFFRERATVEENDSSDYTPTIIYEEKRDVSTIVIVCVLVIAAAVAVIIVLNKNKIAELIQKIKNKKSKEV